MKKNAQSDEILNLVIIFVFITLVFILFLVITYYKVGKKELNIPDTKQEVEIQHDEILIGSIEKIKDKAFYVLVYEEKDLELDSYLYLIDKYKAKSTVSQYQANLDLFFNVMYKKENSDKDKLYFKTTTLIKIEDGIVTQFIEGEAIKTYLTEKTK